MDLDLLAYSSMGGRWQDVSKFGTKSWYMILFLVMLIMEACDVQIFRKEPFFYGHDNHDQLVKIAKVCVVLFRSLNMF